MRCPNCGYENIPGADECADCKNDLTYFDQPATAAGSEVERALMEQPVRELRPARPITVSPGTPLRDVIQCLIDKKIGCVVVTEAHELVGIFTERDVLLKVAGREHEVAGEPVSEWMTPNPETIDFDDSVAYAVHKMDVGGYRHLPVMDAGRVRGVISVRDVVRFMAPALAPGAGNRG
jgi:CBS domain-containing protein